jgi:lambda family phage tail tape measure protein
MADIGSLVVKLAAETAEFHADLGKSARMVEKRANEIKSSLAQVASVAKTAFAVAIGVTSVAALRDFINQTIEAASALQGLSEQTGASVEALSGLAPVATISGTSMENVGASLSRLSKGLAGIDEEGAGATKALRFLGISAKDSGGNLRDPAEVMNDIALKLADFQDGAGKTAIAMELFGKSGASLLPFLKDLAENQDLNIRLSAEQVEQADRAGKALARLKAESNFVAQTLVTASIPAMTVLGQELSRVFFGSQDAVKGIVRLRENGTLTNWAETTAYALAVVIDALRGIGQTIKSVIGSFQAVWADIELAGTFLAGGKGINPFSEENRAKLKAALEKRNQIVSQANKNYVELWEMPLLADAVTQRFNEIRRGADAANAAAEGLNNPRKALNYNTASTSLSANALSAMEMQLRALQRLIDEESDLFRGRQKVTDLQESAGYLSFKQATELRVSAQQEYLDKIRALYADQEAIVRRSLAVDAQTTQDRMKLEEKLADIVSKRERIEREAQQSALERSIRQPLETLKDLQEQAQRGQLELSAIEEQIRTQRDARAISEVESLNKLAQARQQSANQLAQLADQAKEVAQAAPGNERLADAFAKIEEAARRAADGAASLRQRAFELSDPSAGVIKALQDVADEAQQVGKQMENATKRAFSGMTEALVQFVKTGKLDFRSLADSIISDLIRIQIQRMITLPFANAIGTLMAPSAPASGPTMLAHSGGLVGVDQFATRSASAGLFANAPRFHGGGIVGNEVPIIAQKGEAIFTPGQLRALGGAVSGRPEVRVEVHVQNNVSGAVARVENRQQPDGSTRLDVILEQIESKMARSISQGNGLAPTLERRYGLNPAAGAMR